MAAEHGAHLTQVIDAKPSIFELLAQENLNRLTKPAVQYLFKILNKKFSSRIGSWVYQRSETGPSNNVYVIFDLLLQNYYLKNYGGSLAENFYGLRRVPSEWKGKEALELSSRLRFKSLVVLCLFPQVKEWLDKKFEDLKDFQDFPQQTLLEKLQRIFIYTYPFLHMFWQGLCLIYQVMYMFNSTIHYSPILHVTGIRLITSTDDVSSSSQQSLGFVQALRCFPAIKEMVSLLLKGITFSVTHLLSLSIFFIQYLDWWQNTHEKMTHNVKTIPAPVKIKNKFTARSNGGKCLLCFNQRTNETVLATSGFVFCYKCIHKFISENGKCPITKYATNLDQLIRLYQM